jgi:hypothetical protein
LGATYLLVNAVQPSWQRYQELEASVENKEQQIQQKQKISNRLGKQQQNWSRQSKKISRC